MIIREPRETEIYQIAEIEKQCFDTPWSEDSIRASYNNKANRFYVAETDKKPAGYIGLSISVDEGYILNVAVMPAYRRKGVAKTLINEVIRDNKQLSFLTLEVRPSNTAALGLYKSLGFERVGVRKNYYRNPTEDALLLTLFMNKENI